VNKNREIIVDMINNKKLEKGKKCIPLECIVPAKTNKVTTYWTAWENPFKYYVDYCFCWYHYLKNSKNLSPKDEVKKLIFQEELERIKY